MGHGDPKNPKLNPHPQQRYELTVTEHAPGPFDSVQGLVTYEIDNPECAPKNPLEGVHNLPADVNRKMELMRIGPHTYRGYFYRDLLQGEDYFGRGVCHWNVLNAGVTFMAHGLSFSAGIPLFDVATGRSLKPEQPVDNPFSVRDYYDRTRNDANSFGASYAFGEKSFDITVAVREVKP